MCSKAYQIEVRKKVTLMKLRILIWEPPGADVTKLHPVLPLQFSTALKLDALGPQGLEVRANF